MTSLSLLLRVSGVGEEPLLEITENITAVLGKDAYLSCRYLGEDDILSAEWNHQSNSAVRSKRVAGFFYKDKSFNHDGFSVPESITNLTVRMKVSSVEVEGKYICEFRSLQEHYTKSAFVTVVGKSSQYTFLQSFTTIWKKLQWLTEFVYSFTAQPDIQILVTAETINGTHYQSVSCSAVGGRPPAQISWLVNSLPPSENHFTVHMSDTNHSNGTSTLSSTLRFPTHLQDEDSVTCVVQHPTLPNPTLTTARVETYSKLTITAEHLSCCVCTSVLWEGTYCLAAPVRVL